MIAGHGLVIPCNTYMAQISPGSRLGKRCRWVRHLAARRITEQRQAGSTQGH